jgi:flagellar M-ring protein FliF
MAELAPSQAAAPPMVLPSGTPLERVRSFTTQPVVKRALPWFLGLAAIGGAGLAYAALAPAPQRVLYSELGDAERAGVAASLDKAGIAYSIDSNTGTLSVGEDELYKARMLVASDGALAVPDPVSNLDSLPLGASRTLEGERLRGAREHELTLTIKQIDGVDSVRVHLAEGNKSVFVRDEAPPTASVMVRMAKGRKLGDGQVSAIVNLVAGSVPGLSPDAVRVVDQHGQLLTDRSTSGSDRLELQARLEEKLRAQLDQLLTPMLGSGNFTSEIQVELDMDEVTSARESYDKNGVVRTETAQQSQTGSQPGQAGGIPGALSNTPPPATQASPVPPQGGPAPGAAAATAVTGDSSASKTYELGRPSPANSIRSRHWSRPRWAPIRRAAIRSRC